MGLTLGVTKVSRFVHEARGRRPLARQAALTSSWSNIVNGIASSEPVTFRKCSRSVPPTCVV
jgi:hypothetical protein